MCKLRRAAVVVMLLAGWAGVTQADIVNPANVSVVTNGYGSAFADETDWGVAYAFNGSGLKLPLDANNQAAVWSDWWNCPANYSNTGGSMWQSEYVAPPASASLVVNLGGLYNLSGLRMWSLNETGQTGRGVYQGTVAFSTDNITYGTATNFTLTEAPGDSTTPFGDSIAKNGDNIRYVKFTNLVQLRGTTILTRPITAQWDRSSAFRRSSLSALPLPNRER
jgi:hypothetical protein